MLFDLQSPGRKTAVRIIFGGLAFIFFVGFVGFGVGTSGGGGIFDSVSDNGSTDDALKQQIEDAQAKVDAAPDEPEPLVGLIVLRAQSGDRQLEVDEQTGQPVALSEESRQEYEEAISLWQDYLDADPKKINAAAAGAVVQSYRFLGDTEGAIEAQRAFAKSDPSAPTLGALAQLLYFDLQIDKGDEARDQAIAKASADNRKLISKQLAQIRKQAVKAEEEQKKQPDTATGESPELSDPFGGLSPGDPAAQTP